MNELLLSDILRERIRESGLSVSVIARNAGIAQPILHRFYHHQRDLTLRTATKLARYLGLELRPVKASDAEEVLGELESHCLKSMQMARQTTELADRLAAIMDLDFAPGTTPETAAATVEFACEQLTALERLHAQIAVDAGQFLKNIEPMRLAAQRMLAKASTNARKEGRTRRKTSSSN